MRTSLSPSAQGLFPSRSFSSMSRSSTLSRASHKGIAAKANRAQCLTTLLRSGAVRASARGIYPSSSLLNTVCPRAFCATTTPAVTTTKQPTRLQDYKPPDFDARYVDMLVDIGEKTTKVTSRIGYSRNVQSLDPAADLVLDGTPALANSLKSVKINGTALSSGSNGYTIDAVTGKLRIPASLLPTELGRGHAEVDIVTEIDPKNNTALMGLFASNKGTLICTQCEPEGFRGITFYLDRPDVMAPFTVRVHADNYIYPVLLCNGNVVSKSSDFLGGFHSATFWDPYKKPSYLFALVAGRLEKLRDYYTTKDGKEVTLNIWVEGKDISKCGAAMEALKKAFKWDEETFGLSYDLDVYNVVAVDYFTMGAMENKGLNIFNSKYVLAKPTTATDDDYDNIERVIAHEYFHNWTGNRVTCRDWFQISLKEGLTVYREQLFADSLSPVQRIKDVTKLRTVQFAEDAGPLAHPVRPDSYIEINNFYTTTIYDKGAEVVRMIATLVGKEGFRKGMDLYFQKFDGQAVTTEDFVKVMEEANEIDLAQFRLWYTQAGTPQLAVKTDYNASEKTYTINVSQLNPPTPGQPNKAPMHIPLAVGLLDGTTGKDLPLTLAGESEEGEATTRVLQVKEAQQSFKFTNVASEPVPSLLRGFSAPVKLRFDNEDQIDRNLMYLLSHDSDHFNRWEAGNQFAIRTLKKLIEHIDAAGDVDIDIGDAALSGLINQSYFDALGKMLEDNNVNPSLKAEILSLPSERLLMDQMDEGRHAPVDAIFKARQFVVGNIARALKPKLKESFVSLAAEEEARQKEGESIYSVEGKGRRALKNACLRYLVETGEEEYIQLAYAQTKATNMTDQLSAVASLGCNSVSVPAEMSEKVLDEFYQKWKDDHLIVDKWLSLNALSRRDGTLERVQDLTKHAAFDIKNPNKIYSLIGTFAFSNPRHFHAKTGAGYRFIEEKLIELDSVNPFVSARLATAFSNYRKVDSGRQSLVRESLERIAARNTTTEGGLSKGLYEVVTKSLSA